MKYKGKSIFDVLDMTVEEALPFFENGVAWFTILGPNNEKVEFNQFL